MLNVALMLHLAHNQNKGHKMTVTLYHCSFKSELKINKYDGKFGTFLFFGDEPSYYGDYTYKLEINESELIEASSFFYRDDYEKLDSLIEEVKELVNCDDDDARDYLSQEKSYLENGEIDWEIQHLTAQAARKLGYRGVMVPDEYGISYMIEMFEREYELTRNEEV